MADEVRMHGCRLTRLPVARAAQHEDAHIRAVRDGSHDFPRMLPTDRTRSTTPGTFAREARRLFKDVIAVHPMNCHSGRTAYPLQHMRSSAEEPQALLRSTDNVVAAFLAFLAEEQVSARTARLYLGHLGRFAVWLLEHYRADLLAVSSHDLREYRTHLAHRQKPASVNAALVSCPGSS
jgi:hypothetical protein